MLICCFFFFSLNSHFIPPYLPFYSSHRFPRPFFHFEIILICTVVHNKIAKLVHRPTNCTLYEYMRDTSKYLFHFLLFSCFFFPSLLTLFDSQLNGRHPTIQPYIGAVFSIFCCCCFCFFFYLRLVPLILNSVFDSNIICTFSFCSFRVHFQV